MNQTPLPVVNDTAQSLRMAVIIHTSLEAKYAALADQHHNQLMGPFFESCQHEQHDFLCGLKTIEKAITTRLKHEQTTQGA